MATYGLTTTGFIRPNLEDLINSRKTTYRDIFGQNINTGSDSVFDKIASIHANAEYTVWEQMQAVYESQTYQGAEGQYLDNLFAQRGIYRNGRTKATGISQLAINNTVPYNAVYSATTYSINTDFVIQEDTIVAGNILAHSFLNSEIVLGNYIFTIVNTSTSATATLNLNLSNKTPNSTELNTFFDSIKTFIVDNTVTANTDRIYIDYLSGSMYVGFTDATTLVGLVQRVDFKSTPLIGKRYIQLNTVAKEVGFNPVDIGEINTISPQPSGFVSIQNIAAFFSGSEVESDGEYRARASTTISSPAAATRPAIINGLLNGVDGVSKVKIFSNPTGTTSPSGIPPYRFETVVYGGETPAISRKLYELIACSNTTYGTVSYNITTEDEQTEVVYHSKAAEKDISIKVRYKTQQNTPLADSEKVAVIEAMISNINSYTINPTIYNIQLIGVVQKALPFTNFISLSVQIKLATDPDGSYTTNDFVTNTTDVIILNENELFFEQLL